MIAGFEKYSGDRSMALGHRRKASRYEVRDINNGWSGSYNLKIGEKSKIKVPGP
jgi:hypothetical protein